MGYQRDENGRVYYQERWHSPNDPTWGPRWDATVALHNAQIAPVIWARRRAARKAEERRLAARNWDAFIARESGHSAPQRGVIGTVTRAGRRMLVCVRSFAYRDEYGHHTFHAGRSYCAPDADVARLYPHNWRPSDRPQGGSRFGPVIR